MAEDADLLDQAGGQVSAFLLLVQVEALGQAAPVEAVEVDVVAGWAQRAAEDALAALGWTVGAGSLKGVIARSKARGELP